MANLVLAFIPHTAEDTAAYNSAPWQGQFPKAWWPLGSHRPRVLWGAETAAPGLSVPGQHRWKATLCNPAAEGVALVLAFSPSAPGVPFLIRGANRELARGKRK